MSGAHEGCSQGKSVRDREGSKHSTAATPERVDSEAAVLPQDFEDTVHARQLKALCRRVGRRMSRQGPGRSPSMGLTHLNAARPREKSSGVPHCGSSKILSYLVSHRRATRHARPLHTPDATADTQIFTVDHSCADGTRAVGRRNGSVYYTRRSSDHINRRKSSLGFYG